MEPVVSSSSQPLNRKLQQQKVALNAVGFDRKSKFSREPVELHCLLGAWFGKERGCAGAEEPFDMSFSTLVLFWRHTLKLSYVADKPPTFSIVSSAEVFALGTNVGQSHAHISHKLIEKDLYLLRQQIPTAMASAIFFLDLKGKVLDAAKNLSGICHLNSNGD